MKKAIILLLLVLPFFFACTDGSSDSSKPEEKKPTEQTKPEPEPPKGCTSDAECADGKVCNTVTGMCEEKVHELKEDGCDCSENRECKSGKCDSGICIPSSWACNPATFVGEDGYACINGNFTCADGYYAVYDGGTFSCVSGEY